MSKSELVRAFIAVKVPERIAEELENFLAELRPLSRIRWAKYDQFHITLKFLGELKPEIISQVKELLTPMKNFVPFTIELSYIGGFPNLNSPKVLWLSGDKGQKELFTLSKNINEILFNELEIPKETKKFRGHLTLARLRDEKLSEELLRKLGTIKNLSWQCSELFLMKSELTTKGAIYTKLM